MYLVHRPEPELKRQVLSVLIKCGGSEKDKLILLCVDIFCLVYNKVLALPSRRLCILKNFLLDKAPSAMSAITFKFVFCR